MLVKPKAIVYPYDEEFGLVDQDEIDFEAPGQWPF